MQKLKDLFTLKKALAGMSLAGLQAFVATNAQAAGLADLAGAIDTVDIIAGFMAVALLVGAVLASRMGIRKVLSMFK